MLECKGIYMNVTVTELSPNTLSALRGLAQKNGKTLEQYARYVLERETFQITNTEAEPNAEKIKAFEEWMESLDPDIPVLSDEQISRESMYEEQTLRQL